MSIEALTDRELLEHRLEIALEDLRHCEAAALLQPFRAGDHVKPAGMLRGVVVEYNSGERYGFSGLSYKLDFLPTTTMVIGHDAVLMRRTAHDLSPGMVRIVLEISE